MKRPKQLKPPSYLSKSPPVPTPQAIEVAKAVGEEDELDPTRYGDWVKKGIAIDF